MADYLTTDTELTSIANAIRSKGGTSARLSFPAGFVSAINAISTGGGGGQWEDASDWIEINGMPYNKLLAVKSRYCLFFLLDFGLVEPFDVTTTTILVRGDELGLVPYFFATCGFQNIDDPFDIDNPNVWRPSEGLAQVAGDFEIVVDEAYIDAEYPIVVVGAAWLY